MECRKGCGACCIGMSISSPIPGMPNGKPAGIKCVNLTRDNLCALFGDPTRPAICKQFSATQEICGNNRAEAMFAIALYETVTAPDL